jgi:hypothetical protein
MLTPTFLAGRSSTSAFAENQVADDRKLDGGDVELIDEASAPSA